MTKPRAAPVIEPRSMPQLDSREASQRRCSSRLTVARLAALKVVYAQEAGPEDQLEVGRH